MKRIVLISLVLLLAGCGASAPRQAPIAKADPVIAAKEKELADARASITALRGDNDAKIKDLAAGKARIMLDQKIIEAAEKDVADTKGEMREIVVTARQTKIHWLAGILGFVAVGLGIAAWFSPFFRMTLIEAAAGCTGVAAVLLFVAQWAEYFEWIGAALLLAVAGTLLVMWRTKSHALQVLATHFASYSDKLATIAPETRAELDRISLEAQARTPKVKAIIDKALKSAKATI